MALEERDRAAVVSHPLAGSLLTDLRDGATDRPAFRAGLERLGELCGYELLEARFEAEPVTVETPLSTAEGTRVAGREDVVLVSILRAALPFVEGLLGAFPAARQGVVSASRDEAAGPGPDGTFPVAVEYVSLPAIRPDDVVIVADPMLATGSTMCAVLDAVAAEAPGPARLVVLSAVSAPEGLERVREAHPSADLVTVAVDDGLDENGFIVPGLGDAGDRALGADE